MDSRTEELQRRRMRSAKLRELAGKRAAYGGGAGDCFLARRGT